ncbi:MAG TPA: alpha-amylase family glycosyl hydrolase [Candidatus Acidoferrales bacterium]|jgi:cyclomaltodextrinase|nr:alpha-amylase family glycosyl hydrolase [Candidatus Acidoferrales bacterium]
MNLNGSIKFFSTLALVTACFSTTLRAEADVSGATARTSPEWLRAGTIYEIFPRDFSAAGNLPGVTAKLDEMKSLGVTILWVMPIHPIGEKFRKGDYGSPYSIKDYYAIDPHYGTLDDFKKLVQGAHARGMKVIMDIVANHTAWDSVMMTNKSFYKQDGAGNVIPPVPSWTDVAGLNYKGNELREYMIAMLKYWIKEADVDGFRCDVAYMVPTDFWEQTRAEIIKVKPDIMMLAEASKPELLVNAFDIDYSWPLLGTMNDVLIHNAPATKIRQSWEDSRRQFPKGALHMRMSDDHDEARAVARYGLNGAEAASALMFTLDGVPLIYNGMEVGDATESGDPALFDKLNIFWNPKERPQLRKIYHDLIQLRKQYAALRNDEVTWLGNSEEAKVVTFQRGDDRDEFVVVINLSNRPVSGTVKNLNAAEFKPVTISGVSDTGAGDLPRFQLDGYGWRIWHRAIPANTAAK